MKKKVEVSIASFVCQVFVRVASLDELLDLQYLKKCVNGVCRSIGMKKLGRIQVDKLPVENFGINAYSMNQPLSPMKRRPFVITRPLKTSVMTLQPVSFSADTWPECRCMTIVIHSCKTLTKKSVETSLRRHFPGCHILGGINIHEKVIHRKIAV
jgi:hypothetical protein